MHTRDIVVVGASAGGVEALQFLLRGLPDEFPAATFVVLHQSTTAQTALRRILERATRLPVAIADDGDEVHPGQIYVARPDAHLILRDRRVLLSGAPRENGFRPAVDPLFRSAAVAYGPRVIGVVLSGTGDDGTEGLLAIKERGGLAVVQSPGNALFSAMPQSAIENAEVDYVVPVDQIGPTLARLVREKVPEARQVQPVVGGEAAENNGAEGRDDPMDLYKQPNGRLTPLTCPECGGPLWESSVRNLVRYRCLIGHSYSPNLLMEQTTDSTEMALWSAVRALEERMDLADRLARRLRKANSVISAERFEEQRRQSAEAARIIRELLLSGMVSNRLETDADELVEKGGDA